MGLSGSFSPAMYWRAFFFGVALMGVVRGASPAASPPELAQVGLPNEQEAARILEQFRRAGVAGEFYLEFDFRSLLARRPEEAVFKGRLWGGRRGQGSVFRLELVDAQGANHRFLIKNGANPAVWRWRDGKLETQDGAAILAPLVPGIEISAFDLQMPFLYWPGATLEKITRVFGRPAYAFLFRAPARESAWPGGITAARAFLDTQLNALMQTELLGTGGRVVKTFSLISLEKVGDQHIPKQADYRNEVSRDKTRFQVTGAALNLRLPDATFAPEGLAAPMETPGSGAIVRLRP